MTHTIFYCYDAYCGWCYGFSPVIKKLWQRYGGELPFEVLSGGMIIGEKPRPISVSAGYIRQAYKTVEEHTGVKFGQDYLWHINNPDKSDWFPHSEKPAIALSIFKEYQPNRQVEFAFDLQYALHDEGRDLTDDEAYRHLIGKYALPATAFYTDLHSEVFKEKAYYEFALCKQLRVTGYPTVLLQEAESRFHLLAQGYTDYNTLQARLETVLNDLKLKEA